MPVVLPKLRKGLFTHITMAPDLDGAGPEVRKMTQAITPSLVVDLRAQSGCVQDIHIGNLMGGSAGMWWTRGPWQLAPSTYGPGARSKAPQI